tara:strand:- start:2295 stop:2495 length:201 start_codon:yes stop_codon:yes gene_type:complete
VSHSGARANQTLQATKITASPIKDVINRSCSTLEGCLLMRAIQETAKQAETKVPTIKTTNRPMPVA